MEVSTGVESRSYANQIPTLTLRSQSAQLPGSESQVTQVAEDRGGTILPPLAAAFREKSARKWTVKEILISSSPKEVYVSSIY